MSEWQLGGRTIATPHGLAFSGRRILGGVELALNLKLSTTGWQESKQRIDLVPRYADAELRCTGATVTLGKLPAIASTITLANHGWDNTATFIAVLTPAQLRLLEDVRNGDPMSIEGAFWAEVFVDGAREQVVSCLQHVFPLDRDAWLAMLKNMGVFEAIAVEVPLYAPLPADLAEARKHVERAVEARQRGWRGHADAVAECRKALDAIEQAGFASKAPRDVIAFIKERCKELSLAERTAVLHAALQVYFSPTHHAGSGADEMTQVDSGLALAATAGLIQVSARHRATEPDGGRGGRGDF